MAILVKTKNNAPIHLARHRRLCWRSDSGHGGWPITVDPRSKSCSHRRTRMHPPPAESLGTHSTVGASTSVSPFGGAAARALSQRLRPLGGVEGSPLWTCLLKLKWSFTGRTGGPKTSRSRPVMRCACCKAVKPGFLGNAQNTLHHRRA